MIALPVSSSPDSSASTPSRSIAARNGASRRARAWMVSLKPRVSGMSCLLSLARLVIRPASLGGLDVLLLVRLGAARQQDHQGPAIPSEVDPVAGAKVDPMFQHTLANA